MITDNNNLGQELELRDNSKDVEDLKSLLDQTRQELSALKQQQDKQRLNPLTAQGSFVPAPQEAVVETEWDPNDLSYKEQFELYSDELRERRNEYHKRLLRGTEEQRRLGTADNAIRAEENIFIRGLEKYPKVAELKGMKFYLDCLTKGKYSDAVTYFVENQNKRFEHCKELGVLSQVKEMLSTSYLSATPLAHNNY